MNCLMLSYKGSPAARKFIRRMSLALALGASVTGCAVGPKYHRRTVKLEPFHNAPSIEARNAVLPAPPLDQWWTGFRDPDLTRIVKRALDQNLDLAAAMTRVQQARAAAQGAGAKRMPSGNLNASTTSLSQSTESMSGRVASPHTRPAMIAKAPMPKPCFSIEAQSFARPKMSKTHSVYSSSRRIAAMKSFVKSLNCSANAPLGRYSPSLRWCRDRYVASTGLIRRRSREGAGIWVLNPPTSTVSFQPVQVRQLGEELATISGNLRPGQQVVALGAHLLHDGERVRVETKGEVR